MKLFLTVTFLSLLAGFMFTQVHGQVIEDFTLVQNLTGSFGNITSLDSSMDFVVSGSDDNNCTLFWNHLYLDKKEVFSDAGDDISLVDITENGQKILAIDVSGTARIYSESYDSNTYQYNFSLIQAITTDSLGDTTNAYAGAISDDHKKVLLGKASGNVFQYMWNGSQFDYQQTISDLTGPISSISLKGKKMAIAEDGTTVKIYDITSSGQILNQTITFNETNERKTHLDYCSKEDEYYLTIWSPSDDYVMVYQGEGDEQFQLQQTLRFNGSQVNYASLSIKFQRIAVSLPDNFLLYNLDGDLIQIQPVPSFVNLFDHHFGNLILGSNDVFYVYSFCGSHGDYYFYNSEKNQCEECTFDNECIVCSTNSVSLSCWPWWYSYIGMIVGIVIGSVVLIILIIIGVCCYLRRKQNTQIGESELGDMGKNDLQEDEGKNQGFKSSQKQTEDYLDKYN